MEGGTNRQIRRKRKRESEIDIEKNRDLLFRSERCENRRESVISDITRAQFRNVKRGATRRVTPGKIFETTGLLRFRNK